VVYSILSLTVSPEDSPSFMRKTFRIEPLFICLSIFLVGCSSTLGGFFSGYSEQMRESRSAQLAGNFIQAEKLVSSVNSSPSDYGLSQLEKGRLLFLANNWSASRKNFDSAYQQVQAQNEAAKLQISRGFKKAGAIVSNDNAIPYEIPPYEQSMLHSYQALNYIYQGDMEGALVEIRRANLVQERALKESSDELNEARSQMSKQGISSEKFNAAYPSMNNIIGDLKNGFQNAYTFYLSGMLWEAGGESDSAFIDYQRALEIFPNNSFLQQDVLRLAVSLGMTDTVTRLEQRFGKYTQKPDKNTGQVVIVLEQGIITPKEEVKINLPLFRRSTSYDRGGSYNSVDNVKFFSFALPVYRANSSQTSRLTTTINGKTYQSEEIVKLQSLASRNLHDQLPSLVTRQALRLIAKERIRHEMAKKNDLANILTSVYNLASEKADTRSWSSLPNSVQILKMNLPVGDHQLQLSISGMRETVDVSVNSNRITFINFESIGSYIGYQQANL
jgi:hypothetical protein